MSLGEIHNMYKISYASPVRGIIIGSIDLKEKEGENVSRDLVEHWKTSPNLDMVPFSLKNVRYNWHQVGSICWILTG